MATEFPGGVTEDAVLGGALTLCQPKRGHRVGHDAILLAAATHARQRRGRGRSRRRRRRGGPRARAACRRAYGHAGRDRRAPCALSQRNVGANGLADRVRAVALDVAAPTRAFTAAGLAAGSVHRVLMNPPFNDADRLRRSPDSGRALAHSASPEMLFGWIRRAFFVLEAGGTLTLIWRADGLGDVLAALSAGFGGATVLPVYPRPDAAAIRILVRATKGSRAPLALLPGLRSMMRMGVRPRRPKPCCAAAQPCGSRLGNRCQTGEMSCLGRRLARAEMGEQRDRQHQEIQQIQLHGSLPSDRTTNDFLASVFLWSGTVNEMLRHPVRLSESRLRPITAS